MKEKHEKNTVEAARIPPALVAEAKAGDQAAFTELYQRTSAMIYRTIRSMIGDEELVWDVQQDAYLRAWRSLDTLEAPEAFLPWLRRIAVNTAVNALNKRVPMRFSDLAEDEDAQTPELPDLNPDAQPELVLDRKETSRLVRELLKELPPEQQAVVGMHYYEDMPIKDIAALLHVSAGTVKTQLSRGRKRIEAGVRALEQQDVKLYGLSPLPFLLALLGRLEPAVGAEKAALNAVLAEAPAAGSAAGASAGGTAAAAAGGTTTTVTAMTAGQAFFHGLGAKLLAGALAVAVLAAGGKLAYDALKKGDHLPVGPEQPSITETLDLNESPEFPETVPTESVISTDKPEPPETVPTEDVTAVDTSENLVSEPTDSPVVPTILTSGSFGLRQREAQSNPGAGAALPYFRAVDPDADDRIYTNNAVEIRYDGSGVRQRELPDGEERLLFPLERSEENSIHLFGVTENRLYFNCHNPDPDDWWGVSVFSVNRQGEDRQELGSNWDYFFGDGWTGLLSFASDVRPHSARIYNRNDELVFEEPEERVWDMEAVDGSLYVICVKESPKADGSEETEWSEDLIRLDPDGTQTVLLRIPAPSDLGDYGIEATIYNGVIWFGHPSGNLYDLYTLEPLEDRYDSTFYDDSLTWTLDSTGLLTISGSGVMGRCWPQPWEAYRETITAVVLEDGVTNIGAYAFLGCTALKSVSIPDTVTAIGESAFCQCEALPSVTLPDSVTSLGRSVFSGCSELTEVTLPAGLTEIPENLFFGCSCLASLTIPDSVTAIGDYAFTRCGKLTGITLPANVTSVGERAFCNCRALTGITIPASVTSIGNQAFGWDYDSYGSPEDQPVAGFTISGAEGSAAQAYAEENGFRFVKTN